MISRCYNLILRSTLLARFSDAQCEFKAMRADVGWQLLPLVQDTGWFFDTELLVLAEVRAQLGRQPLTPSFPDVPPGLLRQLVRFGAIGALSTTAYWRSSG